MGKDMSAAAKKAWETRRKKYGPKGLSTEKEKPSEETEKAGADSGAQAGKSSGKKNNKKRKEKQPEKPEEK